MAAGWAMNIAAAEWIIARASQNRRRPTTLEPTILTPSNSGPNPAQRAAAVQPAARASAAEQNQRSPLAVSMRVAA